MHIAGNGATDSLPKKSAGGAAGGHGPVEEEHDEDLWSDDDDARADDRADSSTHSTSLGAARTTDKFEMMKQCLVSDMTDETELNKIVENKSLSQSY